MLVLAPSPKLTHLARAVQDGLKKSKHTGNLSVLKDRFDFPDKGHVTLGHIHFGKKTANQLSKKIAQITSSFEPARLNVPKLAVNEVVLFWSNKPALPRAYHVKGTFKLGA